MAVTKAGRLDKLASSTASLAIRSPYTPTRTADELSAKQSVKKTASWKAPKIGQSLKPFRSKAAIRELLTHGN